MALLQILRQSEDELVVKIFGNTVETNALVIDASTLTGAAVGPTYHELAIQTIAWSSTGTNKISLIWDGSADAIILPMEGNGDIQVLRDFNTKLFNNATAPTGDVLLTTTTTDPYSIVIEFEKRSGFTKVGQYS